MSVEADDVPRGGLDFCDRCGGYLKPETSGKICEQCLHQIRAMAAAAGLGEWPTLDDEESDED